MNRMLLYPVAGAAAGVLVSVVIVPMIGGSAPDTPAITLFVSIFLAGTWAIAGAIIGSVEFLKTANRAQVAQYRIASETDGSGVGQRSD